MRIEQKTKKKIIYEAQEIFTDEKKKRNQFKHIAMPIPLRILQKLRLKI